MQFTAENKKRFDELLTRYPVKRSALIPALHLAQEQEGHLSREVLEYLASLLDLSVAQVHDTASFYTMFRFKPEGKTLVEFCVTLSCALGGSEELMQRTCSKLGIRPGGTTGDGRFTVKPVETGEDGRAVLEILYAAYHSAGEGRKIAFPYAPPPGVKKPIDLWRK